MQGSVSLEQDIQVYAPSQRLDDCWCFLTQHTATVHQNLHCCCIPQVIDLISLKPFDMETISKSVKKTRKALIVEECMKTGGIGASLSAVISESLFDELDHQVGAWGLGTGRLQVRGRGREDMALRVLARVE